MVSKVPVLALALRIACRSQPAPLSFVLITVNGAGPVGTVTHAENSDVSFVEVFLAVAVTIRPAATLSSGSGAFPLPSVVTDTSPRKRSPSPLPDASHAVLAK